jgi:hypothetical protein
LGWGSWQAEQALRQQLGLVLAAEAKGLGTVDIWGIPLRALP